MSDNKTFDLSDLTEEFWETVVFFHVYHSSGLGGPGALWLVTKDKKKYYLGFEDLPFNEYSLAENLHPMFAQKSEMIDGRYPYVIEDDGWIYLKGKDQIIWGNSLIREDVYEAFREVALDKKMVKEKVFMGYHNLPDIVGLALGTDSLERVDYIRSVKAQEELNKRIKEAEEEHERVKLLPEHFIWKPMHENNMAVNPVVGEYALIVNRTEDGITAQKFTIVFQMHMSEPMRLEPQKGIESYVLFEKSYHDFFGPIEYPPAENKWQNKDDYFQSARHELAFFKWTSLSDGDMYDYGRFVRCFDTKEAAKEYALCFANANSHIIGNRNTIIREQTLEEDHERRIERYEAYQNYRQYYKEIMDIVANFDGYPSNSSGGGRYLFDAILEGVPEITEKQLKIIWGDIPKVLEKRTHDVIETERQKSMEIISQNR